MSLKNVANETLALLERGTYLSEDGRSVFFAPEQMDAQGGTRLYTPAELEALVPEPAPGEGFEVLDATTQQAARDLASQGVAVLNFASARNAGGGFLKGARAQEEDLCRCSGLYPCLRAQPAYYQANRQQSSLLYTDHAVYSPRVPFFRVSGQGPLLAAPYLASVITMPAPNTGPALRRNRGLRGEIRATFERRWRNVARIAIAQGERNLVLGAWGCGAFQGDPVMVAETARQALRPLRGHFDRVVFAVPNSGKRSAANFAAFRRVLG